MRHALVLLALNAIPVDDPPTIREDFVCEIVRGYVAEFGEAAAAEWARRHHWSEARIAQVRKCLKRG